MNGQIPNPFLKPVDRPFALSPSKGASELDVNKKQGKEWPQNPVRPVPSLGDPVEG